MNKGVASKRFVLIQPHIYRPCLQVPRAKKLMQRMASELVDCIEVYQAEKIDGVHVQKLKIHYNRVGSIEMPNVLPLPQPEALMQTKKE
ncbi:DUF4368 domain-containing protein [Eubacteriales bacterium OttesenSCG-928-N13]|nr:DUF4368 domain-containing protein [Eubacteriales bacterium OttesenSCG-928-N13]